MLEVSIILIYMTWIRRSAVYHLSVWCLLQLWVVLNNAEQRVIEFALATRWLALIVFFVSQRLTCDMWCAVYIWRGICVALCKMCVSCLLAAWLYLTPSSWASISLRHLCACAACVLCVPAANLWYVMCFIYITFNVCRAVQNVCELCDGRLVWFNADQLGIYFDSATRCLRCLCYFGLSGYNLRYVAVLVCVVLVAWWPMSYI